MACITKEQQGKLFQSIGRYISDQEDLNSYSHIEHMNDLFNKFIAAGKLPATALSYVQLMPRYIQQYLLISNKNNLVSDDVLKELSILPKKFENGTLQDVAKELGLTSEEEIKSLFDRWNASLATLDPEEVSKGYASDAILLPTLSDVPRTTHEEIKEYFVHFLQKKPQGKKIGRRRVGKECRIGCRSRW